MWAMSTRILGESLKTTSFRSHSLSSLVVLFVCIGVLLAGVILEKTLSLSTCEAEYKAISRGARVLVGYRQLMEDIGFGDAQPSQMYSDNQAAIAMMQ